jgi:hypothetical protein
MEPQGIANDTLIALLASEGFSIESAARALSLTANTISAARDFLKTPHLSDTFSPLTIAYHECPLYYFILEVVEAIFSLTESCCVCGAPLGLSVLRPSLCDDPVCFFGATELILDAGVGLEIRRDPVVADFLVALASAAYGTKWFHPSLPAKLQAHAATFFNDLPPMRALGGYGTDEAIAAAKT